MSVAFFVPTLLSTRLVKCEASRKYSSRDADAISNAEVA